MFFIIISSVLIFDFSKKELLPMEDRGAYLIIGMTDEGSSFQYTKKRSEDIEKSLISMTMLCEHIRYCYFDNYICYDAKKMSKYCGA